MARGRKRLIAGWGLVGAAAFSLVAIAVSSGCGFGAVWVTGSGNVRTQFQASISRGCAYAGWRSIERPDPKQPNAAIERLWNVQSEFKVHVEQKFELVWWFSYGIGIADGLLINKSSMFPTVRVASGTLILWPVTVVALGGGLPLLFHARRVAKRNRPGLCPACGYDMKGLAAGTGCPECGKAIRARSASEGESAKV